MKGEDFQLNTPKKLIIFGATESGKTTFVKYLSENNYEDSRTTIIDKNNGKKV